MFTIECPVCNGRKYDQHIYVCGYCHRASETSYALECGHAIEHLIRVYWPCACSGTGEIIVHEPVKQADLFETEGE